MDAWPRIGRRNFAEFFADIQRLRPLYAGARFKITPPFFICLFHRFGRLDAWCETRVPRWTPISSSGWRGRKFFGDELFTCERGGRDGRKSGGAVEMVVGSHRRVRGRSRGWVVRAEESRNGRWTDTLNEIRISSWRDKKVDHVWFMIPDIVSLRLLGWLIK